jgi:hypothetical protein
MTDNFTRGIAGTGGAAAFVRGFARLRGARAHASARAVEASDMLGEDARDRALRRATTD